MTASAPLTVAMVAGEASGDLLGAALLGGLAHRLPDGSRCAGIGGPRMSAAGFDARWPAERLAVRGYVEALGQIPGILRIRRALTQSLLADPPAVFVGIDAPDFNFALEHTLKQAGVPTVHFVSPSIWAWRGGRIKKIAKAVDHMLCVFPFEKAIYDKAGVRATYVGHPLADMIPMRPDPAAARLRLGLAPDGPLIGVMPGSRRSEIALIGPAFFGAMAVMHRREPGVRFVLPAASAGVRELLAPLVAAHPDLPLTITDGHSHAAMEAADALLIKSGTSTLEAALYKKPMVISYKVPWLTGQIMRRQGYLPYVGLPNVLAGRFVVPEILQHFATPEALADATLEQLHNEANRRELTELFSEMHVALHRNTAELAAEVVGDVASRREGR
ncbi:lipid-A-disaccharide synthase [Robbsia sp. Bb-Pol-6]|uniref:Lipid-A-disaccharide synthase n=1 Tax=Robbsia betulipollinis TaxID=2981849 RepID=A0ABT3ZIQ6_9BURK|nr:lipid-A-disaccharide synthase [Robbsia betulipollinis]MCY0386302.1 lipid-A-disaccharide synthase [Robbsia betulipollinis]